MTDSTSAAKKAPAKKTDQTAATEQGSAPATTSADNAAPATPEKAPAKTAPRKGGRKTWQPQPLTFDPATNECTVPQDLLDGPSKNHSAHTAALIEALQLLAAKYNQSLIDAAERQNNIRQNLNGILEGVHNEKKEIEAKLAAADQTLGIIGQVNRLFEVSFSSQWGQSPFGKPQLVTSFQVGELLLTYTTPTSPGRNDNLSVASSKDAPAKIRIQIVGVVNGDINRNGINTLLASAQYASDPKAAHRALDKKVLNEIYADDSGGFPSALMDMLRSSGMVVASLHGPDCKCGQKDTEQRPTRSFGKSQDAPDNSES